MEKPEFETLLLDKYEDVLAFFDWAKDETELLTFDVETNSIQEKTALLYGIGLCFSPTQAFYIPIRHPNGALFFADSHTKNIFGMLNLLIRKNGVIGHNIIYDTLTFKNNTGYDITQYIYSDTILLKHLIDEEPPFALKDVAVKYLGQWADKAQTALFDSIKANGGKTTKEQMDMYLAATPILGEYCCYDVILTRMLFDLFEPQLFEQKLDKLFYEEEIMPLYKEVVIPMKDKGFRIDIPHFEKLKEEIIKEIETLEQTLIEYVDPYVQEYKNSLLDEEFPVKKTGTFPKKLAEMISLDLSFEGRVSLAKAHLLSRILPKIQEEDTEQQGFMYWLLEKEAELPYELQQYVKKTQYALYKDKHGHNNVFNLSSNHDLRYLFFNVLGLEPKAKTEKGEPKLDADTLESYVDEHPFAAKLVEMKQLQKLLSTYVEGLLDRSVAGYIYASFLIFGTTSGRFSSRNPNLQNIPRVKDEDSGISPRILAYVNEIKKGFVADEGHILVNADYSQLEPTAFSAACGDVKLQEVFRQKQDLYSAIAIEAEGLQDLYSADKKAANYLKNHKPELRQKYKAVALAVVYGAEAGRISKLLGCSYQEANVIINRYLDAYTGLKEYMDRQDMQAATKGYVRTAFGRIRHLGGTKRLFESHGWKLLDRRWAKANGKEDIKYAFKNGLNNAKNFPIQGMAAHVVNRAMLATMREFKRNGIDGRIIAQVHDELTCSVRIEQAPLAAKILKLAMETTTDIGVPLIAEPIIAANWKEAK